MPICFSKEWFLLHQKKLLWLANTSVGRYILRIHGNRSSVGGRKIIGILPNAIFWREDDGQISGEFQTHNKFAIRLYRALYPLWYAVHAWDMVIANRLKPAWNLGFDTLTAHPDADAETSTFDGYVQNTQADSTAWADVRNAATGTTANDSSTIIAVETNDSGDPGNYTIIRLGALFDTSSLTSSAVISAATFSLNGVILAAPAEWNWRVVSFSPASNTAMSTADFDQFGETAYASDYSSNNYNDESYNDMSLNATGIAAISKTGITKFGVRQVEHDINNSAPSSADQDRAAFDSADAAGGETTAPKLVVTFTLPTFKPLIFVT